MKIYPAYKDSGVEWIGEIPKNWKTGKLNVLCEKITDGSHFSPKIQESGYPYITVKDIQNSDIDFENCKKISEKDYLALSKNGCKPKEKDILLTKDGTIGKAVVVGKNNNFVILSSLGLITPDEKKLNSKFLRYYLISKKNIDQMFSIIHGAALTRLTIKTIKELVIVKPPLDEQELLALFLYHKTHLIDTLIEKKQKQIEMLQEQCVAIINQAVTKGMNPNVKMKDSGIEWLGEVPEHWQVLKLKYLVAMKSGDGITSDSIDDSGNYPVYGGNGLRGFTSSFTHDGSYVLVGRQGALCGNVHLVKGKFWASEHAVVVTQKTSHDIIWIGELLRTMNLNRYSESAAQPGISVEKVQNLYIGLPPEKESTKIAIFLLKILDKHQRIIETIYQKISLLKEYRTTLISEVVTGKIDVRDEAIP